LNILIVEDDPDLARATARQLRPHAVRIAATIGDAEQEIAAQVPDAMICDYELSVGTCEALLEMVTREHPQIRRVLYSGAHPEDWPQLIERGLVHKVLSKPAGPDELLAAIDATEG
jgi:DNA-binding NtrC family response regulator